MADLQAALATVPAMEMKIQQLTGELAVLPGQCDELQQSRVQDAVKKESHDNLAKKEVSCSHCSQLFTSAAA